MSKELILWSQAYSVGIAEIDEQHKKLIDLINRLYSLYMEKRESELKQIFIELKDYTHYHFSTEEKLFRAKNYTGASQHIALHDEFIKELNQLYKNYLDSPKILTMKTMTFLQRWLTNHILKEDKKYSSFLI